MKDPTVGADRRVSFSSTTDDGHRQIFSKGSLNMHGIIQAPPSGQAAPSLGDLAAAIRAARTKAAEAFSTGIKRVREIGDKLKIAKKLTGHGRWRTFLEDCDPNERTARQYMQLADLAAKSAPGTDLTGMSIKAAIEFLSPPNSTKATAPKAPTVKASAVKVAVATRRTDHADIVGAWLAAPLAERVKAIDAIGIVAVWAAIPPDWIPLIEQCLSNLSVAPLPAAPLPAIPGDLSIPDFLRREVLS